jgi:ubiquinone/menaquinone biosynthesis C-methylase UbiE
MIIQGLYDTIAWYDHNAETYAKAQGAWPDLDQIDLFANRLPAGAHVLDAGCAAGRDAALFTKKGLQVEGIDLSHGLIEVARRDHPAISFRVGNFLNLPFPDDHFGGIWAHQSLLHLENPEDVRTALKEFARVLKQSGTLLVLVKAQTGTEKTAVVKDALSNHERFFQYFTKEEATELLTQSGFQVDFIEQYREIDRNPSGRAEVELVLATATKA